MRISKKIISTKIGYFEELGRGDRELLQSAEKARKNAQAPYSNFFVGVAVRSTKSGIMYSGCNVERATWTQTTHAEQNAVDSMVVAEGPVKIESLALVAAPAADENAECYALKKDDGKPINVEMALVPCGHCLQIIWENCFNDPSVRMLSRLPDLRVSITAIGDALPIRFGPKELGVDYLKRAK